MSIKVISLIWEEHTGLLTGIEKSILIRMADFGSDDGSAIYPGKKRLALDSGFSVETIKRALSSLEEKKIITIKNRKTKDQHITNLYSINVKLLQKIINETPTKKTKGVGSVRPHPRVCETPPPRVCETPDPLDYNPYINNNRKEITDNPKIIKPTKAAVVVFLDEKTKEAPVETTCNEALMKKLSDLGVNKKSCESWFRAYGERTIQEKLSMLHGEIIKGTPIASKAAWLNVALRENYKPSVDVKPKIHVSADETEHLLKKIVEREKVFSQSDKSVGMAFLEKLKGKNQSREWIAPHEKVSFKSNKGTSAHVPSSEPSG